MKAYKLEEKETKTKYFTSRKKVIKEYKNRISELKQNKLKENLKSTKRYEWHDCGRTIFDNGHSVNWEFIIIK